MPIFRGRHDLLVGFRAGARPALEEVYWACVDRVERIARTGFLVAGAGVRVAGLGHNPGEVADLVQEVFARAFAPAARDAYDGLRDYTPYLDRIARNLLADRARKKGREVPSDVALLEVAADDEPEEDEGPWTDPDTVGLVSQYLAALSPELKRVHEARHVRSLSQRDAAAALGLSRQALRTLEERLRKGLRKEIARRKLAMAPG
jgi:RNA polymerase sigma-70 factor (ECF subfamily)